MKKRNVLFSSLITILILISFGVFSLNLLALNQILRADTHINFVKLIEKENVQDKVMMVLYTGLMADYCTLKADRQSVIFKYTLAEDFTVKINEAETLFQSILKKQHEQLGIDCATDEP